MSWKSEEVVLDILMKNEAKHGDMLDIMKTLQGYLGKIIQISTQMTCERQAAAQRYMMDGNTEQERLEHLTPVAEDWHCLVAFLGVRKHKSAKKYTKLIIKSYPFIPSITVLLHMEKG